MLGRGADIQRLVRDLHDREKHGVVITGAPGIGKTRLARELVERASKHRMSTMWVVGTAAASTMPLGAFARFLPIPDTRVLDPLQQLQQSLAALRERAADGGLVVGVDNAHHLDPASATLVHELAREDGVGLVLTIRDGFAVPDPITELWTDGLAERFELGPLTHAQFDELVTLAFDEQVAKGTVRQMWELSLGNPLLFRELVRGALETGRLVLDDGTWRAVGDLAHSSRIHELVQARIGSLTPGERNGLEMVAAGEPLGASLAAELVDPAVIEALERRGLVTVEQSERRADLRLAQPIYADVIRQATPGSRSRELAKRLAAVVGATGARRREDVLRVATWMLDSGGSVDSERMVEAARLALAAFDLDLAERFSKAAVHESPFAGNLVHGETLFHQGRSLEAEAALSAAMDAAVTEQQRTTSGLARAFNLGLGLHRFDEAIALLDEECRRGTDQRWCDELTAGLGALYRIANATTQALASVQELLDRNDVSGRPLTRALMVAATSATALGRFERALGYIERARPLWARYPDRRLDEIVSEAFSVFALGLSGDLYTAERVGREGLANASSSRLLTDGVYWAFTLAEILLLRGLALDACKAVEAALGDARTRDPLAMLGPLLSMGAYAAAAIGDSAMARKNVEELRSWRGYHTGGRGAALLTAQQGAQREAAELAAATGRRGVESGNGAWGLLALHDAVRYGHPELVLDDLERLAGEFEGTLAAALFEHGDALMRADAERLTTVSAAFEEMGAMLYSAEAAAQAAVVAQQRHDLVTGGRLATRASRLFDECQGRPSPALMIRPRVLTPREEEIARMAANGLSSKVIAERLFISPRTVDNHLAAVYTKLGIDSRRALPTALGIA
jgi:DNA-binding CsgD family transcriptional regulator/tetratricopeptide (TPR) repeat protein